MTGLSLHEFHHSLNAVFTEVNGAEVVSHYGDVLAEHAALCATAGVIDLSCRSRLCLTGADRARFLHGQITNNVKDLKPSQGCYAALVTAKGKLQSDLNVYSLADELLLDFEPGLGAGVAERFEKFIIADDVQVVDVVPHYGLLSVQGPKAPEVVAKLGLGLTVPEKPLHFSKITDATLGEIYCMNHARGLAPGCDLFVPTGALAAVADKLIAAAKEFGGRACGWQGLELVRVEAGIPRFGVDMDETNLAPEAGIEARAISYSKGCYIGQEVIARIRTYGQVAKALRGLVLPDDLRELPARGAKLFSGEKEVGVLTSAIASPAFQKNIALGYVRREHNEPGVTLQVQLGDQLFPATVTALPFRL
ncbi:MAG: aminomethyl transferase family protein [Verrucomicrobia bacterium]|nr:aminomethyl transferase family protein [Verrucomicrobiota bacterium]